MFRPRNKKETSALFSELIFLPPDEQQIILNHCFPEGGSAHDFMFLNANNGKMYKKFNYITLTD